MTMQKQTNKYFISKYTFMVTLPPYKHHFPLLYEGKRWVFWEFFLCCLFHSLYHHQGLPLTQNTRVDLRPLILRLFLCYISGEMMWAKSHFPLFLTLPQLFRSIQPYSRVVNIKEKIMHRRKLNRIVNMAFLRVQKENL